MPPSMRRCGFPCSARHAISWAGTGAALFPKTTSSKSGNVFYQDGIVNQHYARLYFERYAKLDPFTTGQLLANVGEPISTEDLIAYDEFLETRFYKEWLQPQGIVDLASTILDKSPTAVALFCVSRNERHGLVDDEMRRRLRLIVPHLRRAILVGRVIDLNTATAARFADALDGLTAGMFLVAATGTIVHANTSGHVMLASGDVLRAVDGRLVASDADSTRRCRRFSPLPPRATPRSASGGFPNPWSRTLAVSAMRPM